MPDSLATAKAALQRRLAYPLLGLLAIHVLMAVLRPEWRPLRLAATIAYFGTLLFMIVGTRALVPAYLDRLCEARYGHHHRVVRDKARRYFHALRGIVQGMSRCLLVFVGATAAWILSAWLGLAGIASLLVGLVWWASFVVLLGFVGFGAGRIALLLGRAQGLREESDIQDFLTPWLRPAEGGPGVQPSGPYTFRAAGIAWRWDDLFANLIIFGMPGSGKTSCVLNALLDGLIGSAPGDPQRCPAVFLLDAKGDFARNNAASLRILCRRYGREDDIRIIDPANPRWSERWNPLDSQDSPTEIAGRLAAVFEILQPPGSNDAFFVEACKGLIENAIRLIRATNDPGEPPRFAEIMKLAEDRDVLAQRFRQVTDDDQIRQLESTIDYFDSTWLDGPPETIGSIRAFLRNMLGAFLNEPYSTLFAGRSTVRISEILDEGEILYLNMPIAETPVMARTVSTLIKLEMQREVLRRVDKERYSLFVCDEFQEFATAGRETSDNRFFVASRASRHVNLVATQNLQTLHERLREAVADGIPAACETKIFLQNTDVKTNEYASSLFGEVAVKLDSEQFAGGARFRDLLGLTPTTGSTTSMHRKVPPEDFSRLVKPNRHGQTEAQSIIHRSDGASDKVLRCVWPRHLLEPLGAAPPLLPAPPIALGDGTRPSPVPLPRWRPPGAEA